MEGWCVRWEGMLTVFSKTHIQYNKVLFIHIVYESILQNVSQHE